MRITFSEKLFRPATVIALSATIAPIAGMLIGAILYIAGTVLLISSKETEPEPGWKHADERDAAPDIDDQAGKPDGGKGENRDSSPDRCRRRKGKASVLRTSPVVRVQFAIMILFGAVYGSFDVSAITYCESIDSAGLASIVFAAESAFSVFVSLLFGMIGFTAPLRRQFVVFSVLFGCLYALFAFVGSPESLVIIACAAALSYAPMYITTNVTCERAVPSANLTEALSWLGSGQNIGMVIGPVTTGLLIDAWGPLAGFDLTACYALAIIACALACIPVLRKHL